MKVVIFKSYRKQATLSYNYGDDYEDVWHNFNAIEKYLEVSDEELEVLKRAINHLNTQGSKNYTLGFFEIAEEEEVKSLLSDFRDYEKKEALKAEKLNRERMESQLVAKAKSEAKRQEKAVKKYAKDFNLSEDEVRIMLAKSGK